MQPTLDFPVPLTERYRPQTIDGFIGIDEAKRQAKAILRKPMPNTAYLFAGESGLGKTTLALAIAKAMNAQLHHLPARDVSADLIEKTWEAVHYSTWTGSNHHVVLCDEADLLRIDLQQRWLSILDSTGNLDGALFGDWRPSPPQAVWIFTTNADVKSLWRDSRFEQRFLSRVRIVPFSNYGIRSELADYLRVIWDKEVGTEDGNGLPDFTRIAKELRGNVRACLMELEREMVRHGYPWRREVTPC